MARQTPWAGSTTGGISSYSGVMVGGGGTSSGESKKANSASNKKKIAAFKAGRQVA